MFSVSKLNFKNLQVFRHMVWEIDIWGVRATEAIAEEKWQRFMKWRRMWPKNDESYPSCQNWQAQRRQAPGLEMTHSAALTFFRRHCSYAVATLKLTPVKLQMPRMCISTAQETCQSSPVSLPYEWCCTGPCLPAPALATPGLGRRGFAGMCREPATFLLPEHPSWRGQGQKGSCFHRGKSWLGPSETGGHRRVCPRVGRDWINLPTAQHFFSDLCGPFVSPGWGLFVWAWLLYVCQALLLFSKGVPKWDLLLRNNKTQAGSHTLFIFPGFFLLSF